MKEWYDLSEVIVACVTLTLNFAEMMIPHFHDNSYLART